MKSDKIATGEALPAGMSAISSLSVQKITIRSDARAISEAALSSLEDSIVTVGLINPIRVRAIGPDLWEVIAGAHRLTACRRLGLIEIDCVIVQDDDLHAELAMIDENLCRAELSPSDRASQTARRKAIYLEINPDTAHGGDRSEASRQLGDLNEAERFTADTARATGQSERTVQRIAERGEKILPEVLDLIRGTTLDTGAYLDKLKKLAPNDQVTAAKRDLAMDKQQAKAARDAEQAKHDRQKQDMVDQLPASIVEIERAKADRSAAPPVAEDADADDLEELRNVVAAQKDEIEGLQRKVARFDDMVVEFERGGFENVIAGLEQRIDVLRRQVERESHEKVKNLRAADYWKKKALEAGANDDVVIDMATGEMSRG